MEAKRAIRSYKDLNVWKQGMDLVEAAYKMTAKMPKSEEYGLTSQVRRSAVSIPSNIAEGYGRQATGEYRHHLCIARGSLLELETQLLLCQRIGGARPDQMAGMLDSIQQLNKMLTSLIGKLN